MKGSAQHVKLAVASVIAVGVAGLGVSVNASAQTAATDARLPRMTQAIMANLAMKKQGWVDCYGISALNKNSCKTATVSCGGNANARDPDAYIRVPAGLCTRIAGGSLKPVVANAAAPAAASAKA